MRRIRLVIADRRPIVLQGFQSLLAAEGDFEVVASCLDGTSCLDAMRSLMPDVALVEDGFADVTAAKMLAATHAEKLTTRLVFYTASVARGDIAEAIAAGACNAISMRAKPEAVLNSLRLVAPQPVRPVAGTAEGGDVGDEVLATLTDDERKVMRLVGYGLSNKAIARQLNVSPAAVKAEIDHLLRKLRIGNRPKLASLALSRLSGGVGLLAALIFAALDDAQSADHAPADPFTITAADGTAEAATITVTPRKPVGSSAALVAAGASKAGRVDHAGKGRPAPAGPAADLAADFSFSASAPAALNAAKPSLGSSGAFMMVAAGVLLYELEQMCRPAQAFAFDDIPSDVSTSAAAESAGGWFSAGIFGSAYANHQGFENPAPDRAMAESASDLGNSDGISLHRNAFEFVVGAASTQGHDGFWPQPAGDLVDRGKTASDGPMAVDALAGEASDHVASGETAMTQALVYDTAASGTSHRIQSQRDAHASEQGLAAPGQSGKNATRESESSRGESQRDLHKGESGAAHHDASANDSRHEPHATGRVSASPGHGNKHEASAGDAQSGPSQRNVSGQPANHSGEQHAKAALGGDGEATGDVGAARAPAFQHDPDSFHFRNEATDRRASSLPDSHVDHRPASTDHGHEGRAPLQAAELTEPAFAEHQPVAQATGVDHHPSHFIIV